MAAAEPLALRAACWCSATWSATAPIPNAVVDRVRDARSRSRSSAATTTRSAPASRAPRASTPSRATPSAGPTTALTAENRDWLAALPAGPMIVDDLIEICHGTPFDEDDYIFDDLDALRAMHAARRPLCLFGHTHVPVGHYLSRDQFGARDRRRSAAADDCRSMRRTATWSTRARSASRATAIRAPAFGIVDTDGARDDDLSRRRIRLRRRRRASSRQGCPRSSPSDWRSDARPAVRRQAVSALAACALRACAAPPR